jgi:hypothetical protein
VRRLREISYAWLRFRRAIWQRSPVYLPLRASHITRLRYYARILRHRIEVYRRVTQLDNEKASEVALNLRRMDRSAAYASYRYNLITERRELTIRTLGFGSFFVLAWWLSKKVPRLSLDDLQPGSILIQVVIFCIALWLVQGLTTRIFWNQWLPLLPSWITSFVRLSVPVLYIWAIYRIAPLRPDIPDWLIRPIAIAILLIAIRSLSHLAIRAIRGITHYQWYQSGLRQDPDAVICNYLLNVLVHLVDSPGRWHHLGFRADRMYDLEMCARCIDQIPRRVRGHDPETDILLHREARLIAGPLRKMKVSLINPPPEGREAFLNKLLDVVNSLGFGDMSSLERLEAHELPQKERLSLRQRLPMLVLGVVKALTPFVIALLATRVGVGESGEPLVEGTLANYIVGGTIIYAVLTFLMTLDPQLSQRITLAKEIMGMAPGAGKEESPDAEFKGPQST